MKIEDMIVLLPISIVTTVLKFARFDLNSEDKKYIAENHLYHCVSSKDVADSIIKSGYLRPATGALKTLNSYGHASVCLFGGIPNTDNFMKNLNTNLYTEPDKIINAIEICVHEDELNRNYKARKVSDDAILYEGYCVLPQERTRAVQLVMDLKRDEYGKAILGDNGRPIGFEAPEPTPEPVVTPQEPAKPSVTEEQQLVATGKWTKIMEWNDGADCRVYEYKDDITGYSVRASFADGEFYLEQWNSLEEEKAIYSAHGITDNVVSFDRLMKLSNS